MIIFSFVMVSRCYIVFSLIFSHFFLRGVSHFKGHLIHPILAKIMNITQILGVVLSLGRPMHADIQHIYRSLTHPLCTVLLMRRQHGFSLRLGLLLLWGPCQHSDPDIDVFVHGAPPCLLVILDFSCPEMSI